MKYQSILQFITEISSAEMDLFMEIGTALGRFYNVLYLCFFIGLILTVARFSDRKVFNYDSRFWRLFLIECLLAYAVLAAVVYSLKLFFKTPRPYVVYGERYLRSHEMPDSIFSFPSGHAAFAAMLVFLFWPVSNKIMKFFIVAFFCWVALSRIYLGMHFPGDVLFSALIAAIVYVFCKRLIVLLSIGKTTER